MRLGRVPLAPWSPRACTQAVELNGYLRCDEEAWVAVQEACGTRAAQRVRVGDSVDAAACAGARGSWTPRRMRPEALAELALPVDVNGADALELASLDGVGPTIAARIVAARPLPSIDALLDVRGIGPVKLARMRSRVRLGPTVLDWAPRP